jgi:putative colanic acid biosynthesis acetyltransferase WcaF
MIQNKQDLNAFKMPHGFRGRSALTVQLWWITQALFFKTSPQVFYNWRRTLLRLFGAQIGKGVKIRPSATVTYPWKVSIGDYSWVGDEAVLYSLGEIHIGSNAVVSQKCYLCAGNHDYTNSVFTILAEPVIIKDQVWLATDVFVGPGVTIGEGAVVGARSSIFKSIEGGNVYSGNPLKMIKKR